MNTLIYYKEWPKGSGRIGCLSLVVYRWLVSWLNGFCFLLWMVLIIVIISALGTE